MGWVWMSWGGRMKKVFEMVAANGLEPLKSIINKFEQEKNIKAEISHASINEYWAYIEITEKGSKETHDEKWVSGKIRTWSEHSYRLIFDTSLGFIEKLVGDKTLYGLRNKLKDEDGFYKEKVTLASYHRRELANMTLEEMKDYINKLGEV
jgi:hypothetical protein